MPKLTAQQARDKYRSGVQGGASAYQAGINSVKTAPSQKAIAQKAKMVTNWMNAVNSGKWEEKMGEVTLTQWQQASVNKGAQNYTASAEGASSKWGAWATDAFPVIAQIQAEVDAMPSTSLQDNIQRMIYNVTEMANRLG